MRPLVLRVEAAYRVAHFVLLSQALHHADRPRDLLAEIRRVLKPTGVVIVIGEEPLHSQTRHLVRWLISFAPVSVQRSVRGKMIGRVPLRRWRHDPVLGDRKYTRHEYRRLFRVFTVEAVDESAWLLRP